MFATSVVNQENLTILGSNQGNITGLKLVNKLATLGPPREINIHTSLEQVRHPGTIQGNIKTLKRNLTTKALNDRALVSRSVL